MKKIKFNELKHMDMIYYVRGVVEYGKARVVSEIRYVQNPEPNQNFVWTYLMTESSNDPCLKIKKHHIVICVHPGDNFKTKTTNAKNSEFKRLFLHESKSAAEIGRKGGQKSKRKLTSDQARIMAAKSAEKRKKKRV